MRDVHSVGPRHDNPLNETNGPDGRVYVFDRRHQIYKPKRPSREDDHDPKDYGDQSPQFRSVEVRRDWWVFGISTLVSLATFLVVCAYTYFAQQQVYVSEAANFNFMKSSRDTGKSFMTQINRMQAQVEATGRLADAAGRSAIAAESANRPYIGVNGTEIVYLGPHESSATPGSPTTTQIQFKVAIEFWCCTWDIRTK